MDRKRLEAFASIPQRANLVLYIVFVLFAFLCFRIWYISVLKHTSYSSEAFRSRRLIVKEPAMRGTIRDRFHITLAANAIDYRVGVLWGPIQEIPRTVNSHTEKKEKIFLRKKYIKALAELLGKELSLDPSRIEDAIYSYAIYSSTGPFFLKTGLDEAQYYRLNMLAKDWPGLVVERVARRVYPLGKTGCHVIGYIAPQNREEYEKILFEKIALQDYVNRVERGEDVEIPPGFTSFFAVKEKLLTLERKAYTISDAIGKSGVEATFEGSLRGLSGQKCFATNAQGEIIRRIAGSKEPVSGKRLILTISSELQAFCEMLLEQNEKVRRRRQEKEDKKYPIVSGGAIVALDPVSFEVLACASHPDFDPNDFVRLPPAFFDGKGSAKAMRWARGEGFFRKIWDLEWLLDESKWLSWDFFLSGILPKESALHTLFAATTPIKTLILRQRAWSSLSNAWQIDLCDLPEKVAKIAEVDVRAEDRKAYQELKKCFALCTTEQEKFLLFDLSRLLISQENIEEPLFSQIGDLSIEEFRKAAAAKVYILKMIRHEAEEAFRKGPFAEWRAEHESSFLKEKRAEEKVKKTIARPFLYYIDKECARQFSEWWEKKNTDVLLTLFSKNDFLPFWLEPTLVQKLRESFHDASVLEKVQLLVSLVSQMKYDEAKNFLSLLRGYDEQMQPLLGEYGGKATGKDLIQSFFSLYPSNLASFAHMQPHPQGSIFKLTVAYAALQQRLEEVGGDQEKLTPNFFTLTDKTYRQGNKIYVGCDSKGKPIPQLYKNGRIPKSVDADIGMVDLVRAIERSSNPYFALLASDYLKSPEKMLSAARLLGYGEKTGVLLPNEAKGRLPSDLEENKTGVYTTAIGQHTMLATPLQTSVALSALATGEVAVPRILRMAIGPEANAQPDRPYMELMQAIGISFPIWMEERAEAMKKRLFVPTKNVSRTVPISSMEQQILARGMKAVSERLAADVKLRGRLKRSPALLQALDEKVPYMLGKSSTAQSFERLGPKLGQKPAMYDHTWFGGIFLKDTIKIHANVFEKPELTVVVFLRYGSGGKDAAPLAAAVAKEWKSIQAKGSSVAS